MGLAGQKNKRKWAKDPNNTAWSRNTDTFGHKIMRSQGWAPGDYLGAKDASHSEYFGSANASHIRAVVKDDNMGLGARRNQGDECTGLDALQDLLSRLNGRADEAVAEDKRKREDTRTSQYLARKLGTIRFVCGGLLVGDKVQELADSMEGKEQGAARVPGQDGVPAAGAPEESSEEEDDEEEKEEEEEEEKSRKKEKKSKKRKAEEDGEGESRKERKSRKRRSDDDDEDSKSRRKEKKDKKRRKEKEDDESRPDEADEAASARKKAKKEKKEKRRKSREDGDDIDKSSDDSEPKSKSSKKKRRKAEKEAGGETSPPSTKTPTPAASGISTPIPNAVPHRHLARSRFIAQKRAAVMDQAALNQIFMIKA